jgi:hypothetical protein
MIEYNNKLLVNEINYLKILLDKDQIERLQFECFERTFSIQIIDAYNNSALNKNSFIPIEKSFDSIIKFKKPKYLQELNKNSHNASIESFNSIIDSVFNLYISTKNCNNYTKTVLIRNVLQLDPNNYADTNYRKLCMLLKVRNFIRVMIDNLNISENQDKMVNSKSMLIDITLPSMLLSRNNENANNELLIYNNQIIEKEIKLLSESINNCYNGLPIKYINENKALIEITNVYRLNLDTIKSSTSINNKLKFIVGTYCKNKKIHDLDSSTLMKNLICPDINETKNKSIIQLNILLSIRNCLFYISENTCTSEMDMDKKLYKL